MGKTFCSKHERFYETACEYCVAPALPVVAAETVRNPALPKYDGHEQPLSATETLEMLQTNHPRMVKCACGNFAFDRAMTEPFGLPMEGIVDGGFHTPKECKGPWQRVPQRLTKITLDKLFASPPMVQDAPYDPAKAPIGKRWPRFLGIADPSLGPNEYRNVDGPLPLAPDEVHRRMYGAWAKLARIPNVDDPPKPYVAMDMARGPDMTALILKLRTGDLLDLRGPHIATCRCGRFVALSGTIIEQPTPDGALHTPDRCERQGR